MPRASKVGANLYACDMPAPRRSFLVEREEEEAEEEEEEEEEGEEEEESGRA